MFEKKRKELVAKNKEIAFSLSKEMSMPSFTRIGFARKDVENLFINLASEGFGEYIKGKQGKGCSAKFIANDKCPNEYILVTKVMRLHKQKENPYVPAKQVVQAKQTTIIENKVEELSPANKIRGTRKVTTELPSREDVGYACTINDNYLYVDRIQGAGYNSITDALGHVWNDIKQLVSAKGAKHMTPKQEVVSRLMGLGYYKLEETNNPNIDKEIDEDDE